VGIASTRTARVPTFNNLSDDSLLDVCKTPSPEKMVEKHASPPPSVSGEILHFSFALLLQPSRLLCRSYPACALAGFAVGEFGRRLGVLSSSCKFCFAFTFWYCCTHFDRLFYFTGAYTIMKAT
jgi:hypothetical protein